MGKLELFLIACVTIVLCSAVVTVMAVNERADVQHACVAAGFGRSYVVPFKPSERYCITMINGNEFVVPYETAIQRGKR